MLRLLQEAAKTYQTELLPEVREAGILPSLAELRSVIVQSLTTADARVVRTLDTQTLNLGYLSANGAWLALRKVSPGPARQIVHSLHVYSTKTGQETASSKHPDLLAGEEELAITNDGRWIAVLDPREQPVQVWDFAAEAVHKSLPLSSDLIVHNRQLPAHRRMWKISFSPDGHWLAACAAPKEGTLARPTP